MAGSEGTGQTELLTGWSCVVHRPSEDPEPSELPSTVDITAFSSGLPMELTQNPQNDDSCDSESDSDSDSHNSGSDISGSCSVSETSESDSSTSSPGSSSRSSSPEFSVTSSQTNGLRLKIATVRKSCTSPPEKCLRSCKQSDKNAQNALKPATTSNLSSSWESLCSRSGSNCTSDSGTPATKSASNVSTKTNTKVNYKEYLKKSKVQPKQSDKGEKHASQKDVSSPKPTKCKPRTRRSKKVASLSRVSTGSSSDSENSDADSAMLASYNLQEIRQEDLTAILPDQQECDTFGGFDYRLNKSSPQTGRDASGSDMELPQQAVNALIQRTTESSSESESHSPPNPGTLYANSLLQQFVAQTQLLNAPTVTPQQNTTSLPNHTTSTTADAPNNATKDTDCVKRKRGRPRKSQNDPNTKTKSTLMKSVLNNEYCTNPNVSPDSGIQNSSDHVSSPEPSPRPNSKQKGNQESKLKKKTSEVKINNHTKNHKVQDTLINKIAAKHKEALKLPSSNRYDRLLYANADKVLYPPRRKVGRPPRKGPGRPSKLQLVVNTVSVPTVEKCTNENKMEETSSKVDSKSGKVKKYQQCETGKKIASDRTEKCKHSSEDGTKKKSKSFLLHEICERVSKHLELDNKYTQKSEVKRKHGTKAGASKSKANNGPELEEPKYTTFKNAKIMHSKHKHKKHKKCKFKILKPLTAGPSTKTNTDVDKLVADFVKLCSISISKPKEIVPDVSKTLKKPSKKRKASDYSERKKKKQNVGSTVNCDTNSNEQRLPLKKRHYHLSTNDSKPDQVEEPAPVDSKAKTVNKTVATLNNKTVEKSKSGITIKNVSNTIQSKIEPFVKTVVVGLVKCPNVTKMMSTSPKPLNLNNTTKLVRPEVVCTHIDEAIEACITKYTGNERIPTKPEVRKEKSTACMTATTPKKRHRLEIINNDQELAKIEENSKNIEETFKTSIENVVTELKMKQKISESGKKPDKKIETAAHILTRKKNRLEDLTSSLVSKINSFSPEDGAIIQTVEDKSNGEFSNRASVIKSPVCKKVKSVELDKLEFFTDTKPTGIFMPTMDLELHIPASTIKTNQINNKENLITNEKLFPKDQERTEEAIINVPNADKNCNSINLLKRKVRKRRAINRTGFPTVKKKKKKASFSDFALQADGRKKNGVCDRVPQDGEKYSTFLERTEKNIGKLRITESVASTSDYHNNELENNNEQSNASNSSQTDDIKYNYAQDDITDDIDELTLEARLERSQMNNGQLGVQKEKMNFKVKIENERYRRSYHRVFEERYKLRDFSPSSTELIIEKKYCEDVLASGDEGKRNRKPPRWRKKYLVAGLFSDYYKEDDEMARQRRNEAVTKSRFLYNPKEHPYGLLPPPYHCGRFLRCRKKPFQLPYDLWWQHMHSSLPGRDTVPSWNYRKIRTNVYNVKTSTGACEPQSCNCTSTSSCGDDCINRLVLAECPATHKCQNQKIQRHEWAPGIEKFMTESKGWGVCTKEPIKNGDFILEYVGEVVPDHEFKERMASRYSSDIHHYCLHLDGGLVIDGHRMGGAGRFVNHSCQPNCEMQKWSVNGQFRMALFALRDIESYEELTYDYNFSLFNPAEGQECKCGSENCRGVIGGKSQRVRQSTVGSHLTLSNSQLGRVGRPRKNQAKRTTSRVKEPPVATLPTSIVMTPQIKPLSQVHKVYVLEHHCFLLRNLSKVRRIRERSIGLFVSARTQSATPIDHSATFINHLNALRQPRNMRTRRLAQAEDDPELNKTARLATVLRDLRNVVCTAKDENNEFLSASFMTLPSKRKVPEYYQRVTDPIDLSIIEQNIATGNYRIVDNFDIDMNRLFANVVRFFGRTSEPGIAATRLKKIYNEAKQHMLPRLREVLGAEVPPNFVSKSKNEEEDVIRCICGLYRDEGVMIQCERCLVWQHCECVRADPSAASYHCERCVPRIVDYEISLNEFTEHGHQYYMSLMRGELQLRQGDTVYVLRDIAVAGTDRKHTYKTIGEIKYSDLDIFRIERLWKDSKTDQRFAYGHHYLRPHETFHEPTRKFFPNEVMRVPLYEAVPVDLIMSHCWVMDLNTYCKGRPFGASEEHIYICEYRVDKSARLFSKISKSKYPVCTKSYAFERFDVRLKISRTYTPHDLDPAFVKPRGRKPQETDDQRELSQLRVSLPVIRTRSEQKARLNRILLNLLSKMPTKQVLDISYLLEGGRRRKKQT